MKIMIYWIPLLFILFQTTLSSKISQQQNLFLDSVNDPNCSCFNCQLEKYQCLNYAKCDYKSGACLCREGFGGENCGTPQCGRLGMEKRPDLDYNQTSYCSCQDGFYGQTCNVCQTDEGCQLYRPGDERYNATCYKGGIVVDRLYSHCSLENEAFKKLLEGQQADASFECVKSSESCQFEFWIDGKENFYCQLQNCTFVSESLRGGAQNNTNSFCEDMKCKCVPGATLCGGRQDYVDISELLDEVKGPASIQCKNPGYQNDRYNCEFDEPVLREQLGPFLGKNPVIELKCRMGQCLMPYELPDYSTIQPLPTFIIYSIVGGTLFASVIIGLLIYKCISKYQKERLYQMIGSTSAESEAEKERERMLMLGYHTPATLMFHGIGYEIRKQGMKKSVLKGVSGIVYPGEVLAIMGASGAGKTTCLDILAGKTKRGVVSGQLRINGQVPTRTEFKRISGYVDQEDTLLPTLTVFETLLYSAELRLPATLPKEVKISRVQKTMAELGIEHIANSRIGSARDGTRGISGGERRRVSIAMEVVTSPSLLYLDEPTSGLDSYSAMNVIESLVTLAKKYNRTIIMSIHQPRSDIFSMFDKLLLLAEGGYMVYSGPIYKQPKLITDEQSATFKSKEKMKQEINPQQHKEPVLSKWLEDLGVGCPVGFNMADYLIDLTNMEQKELPLQSAASKSPSVDVFPINGLPEKGDHKLSKLGSIGEIKQMEGMPEYLTIWDREQLEVSRPFLYRLVTGFVKSFVCKELKEEIDQIVNEKHDEQPEEIKELPLSTPNLDEPELDDDEDSLLLRPTHQPLNSPSEESILSNQSNLSTKFARNMSFIYHSLAKFSMPAKSDHSRPGFRQQFMILSQRTLKNFFRNPVLMILHYGAAIILGISFGLTFWQLGGNMAGFQNRMGFFFFIFNVFGFAALSSVVLFTEERAIFVKERSAGFYGVGVYFLSKILFDILPLRLLPALMLGSICYYMIGLVPAMENFLKCLLVLVLFNLTAASMCLIVAALFKNVGVGILVGVFLLQFNMLFGGFVLSKKDLNPFIRWLPYVSFYNYALEAVLVNEMTELMLKDEKVGLPIEVAGTMVLETLGFQLGNYWNDVISLFWMFIGFLIISFLVLQFHVKERR